MYQVWIETKENGNRVLHSDCSEEVESNGTTTLMIVSNSEEVSEGLFTLQHFHILLSKEMHLSLIGWNKSNANIVFTEKRNPHCFQF